MNTIERVQTREELWDISWHRQLDRGWAVSGDPETSIMAVWAPTRGESFITIFKNSSDRVVIRYRTDRLVQCEVAWIDCVMQVGGAPEFRIQYNEDREQTVYVMTNMTRAAYEVITGSIERIMEAISYSLVRGAIR